MIYRNARNARLSNASRVGPHAMAAADDCDEARIGEQIQPQANGCWFWKGQGVSYGNTKGSGQRVILVHRFVYETLVGEIPEGCHLHHKCETPGCCNPAHLVPLTPKEHRAAHREIDRH